VSIEIAVQLSSICRSKASHQVEAAHPDSSSCKDRHGAYRGRRPVRSLWLAKRANPSGELCLSEKESRAFWKPGPEDWREWILHVSDGDGEEIFEMPFSSLLGRPH
jgi:hypothetical protein